MCALSPAASPTEFEPRAPRLHDHVPCASAAPSQSAFRAFTLATGCLAALTPEAQSLLSWAALVFMGGHRCVRVFAAEAGGVDSLQCLLCWVYVYTRDRDAFPQAATV